MFFRKKNVEAQRERIFLLWNYLRSHYRGRPIYLIRDLRGHCYPVYNPPSPNCGNPPRTFSRFVQTHITYPVGVLIERELKLLSVNWPYLHTLVVRGSRYELSIRRKVNWPHSCWRKNNWKISCQDNFRKYTVSVSVAKNVSAIIKKQNYKIQFQF